jgi:hypothetical protein
LATSVAVPHPGYGSFLIPGSGMGKNPDPGSRILDEHQRQFFRELKISFGLKILKFIDTDTGSFRPWVRYPGSKNSYPRSVKNIQDPQLLQIF